MSAPTADRPATGVFSPTRAEIPQRTLRTDRWWMPTVLTNLGLGFFVVYATIRAFWGSAYWVADYHYLTPFYSPCVSKGCIPEASHFGQYLPDAWWLPFAAFSLPFLLLFRLTCYYYRKAYYRSVWQSPPGCAVAEPHSRYTGETKLPLIMQNLHRYFFYAAFIISLINTYDAILAFHSPSGFGFGLGNIILVANVILLWLYTAVLPLVQACHRWSTETLLEASGAVLAVDSGQCAQHPAHAVGVDHHRHADTDRLLHHAGGQRHHPRLEIHWLTSFSGQLWRTGK